MSGVRGGSPWQLKDVETLRLRVFERLDQALASGIEARLEAALSEIANPQRAFKPIDQLERLLYVIAALAHHARWGGLSDRDAGQLVNVAEAILRTHGVDKSSSTLSGLWGELHLANSQIMRLSGRTFESMWEHQLGHQASRRAPVGTPAFHSLASGLRALRLGMVEVASAALHAAETGDLPPRNREQARLARVQAARLGGHYDEAARLLDILASDASLSPLAMRDAAWEGLVQTAQTSGDLGPMTVAVSARGEHRYPTFALEAFLWTRAAKSRQFEERLTGIKTLRRVCGDLLGRASAFRLCFDACSHLDDAYDPDRPLALRTRGIGEVLQESHRLPSLDKEMLLRAATFRWLYRAKQMELAAFVFADYELKSLQLTSGRDRDVGRFVQDVDRDALLAHYVSPSLRSAS